MGALIDMIGMRFGYLTVAGLGPTVHSPNGNARRMWGCFCDCGRVTFADRESLRRGNTKSCGCKKNEMIAAAKNSHRLSKSSTFNIWAGMIARCKPDAHPRYGSRGIKVCKRWQTFENFLSDMGERPSNKHTIDRIDNDGNYEPGNCRWIEHKLNCRNKSNNLILTHQGESRTLAEWSERTGLARNTIRGRIRLGWPVEQMLTTPARQLGVQRLHD